MKSKKVIRPTIIVLTLIMLICSNSPIAKARASDRFATYSATLKKTTNGDLSVFFTVTASSTMDTLGASKIDIQWYNGSRWVTEKTYTSTDVPKLQTSNATHYAQSVEHTPAHTGPYHAIVTFYAEDSDGKSTVELTTR